MFVRSVFVAHVDVCNVYLCACWVCVDVFVLVGMCVGFAYVDVGAVAVWLFSMLCAQQSFNKI